MGAGGSHPVTIVARTDSALGFHFGSNILGVQGATPPPEADHSAASGNSSCPSAPIIDSIARVSAA